MNGERASLVGCPFFVFCCQKNMLPTLRNLSNNSTFRRVEWVFLIILSGDFGNFRGFLYLCFKFKTKHHEKICSNSGWLRP